MQMQNMNQYGNRGYGGPPQPQRQGGRRGINRGGFRNSRFEHNQRGPNNMGNQRPINEVSTFSFLIKSKPTRANCRISGHSAVSPSLTAILFCFPRNTPVHICHAPFEFNVYIYKLVKLSFFHVNIKFELNSKLFLLCS